MKVALVYDRVNKWGGAERVLGALHHIWPEAPLYTSVYNPASAQWAHDIKINPSWLNNVKFFRTRHQLIPFLMPYVFESFQLDTYDIIISVTSAEAKGVITKPHQLHICYMLTPTRYLWSHTHQYLEHGLKKSFRSPLMSALRYWDSIAASRPDIIIPISKRVEKRVSKYYGRSSHSPIYPPAEVKFFSHHPKQCHTTKKDYYLVVGRPVGYKMHQEIAKFAAGSSKKFIFVGPENHLTLKQMIKNSDEIVINPKDTQLACLYHHAKALILPQEEDFGLTAVEAMSAGTPVIINQKSGAAELVQDGIGGIFLKDFTQKTFESAISAIESRKWASNKIQNSVKKYDTSLFQSTFKGVIEKLWQAQQT